MLRKLRESRPNTYSKRHRGARKLVVFVNPFNKYSKMAVPICREIAGKYGLELVEIPLINRRNFKIAERLGLSKTPSILLDRKVVASGLPDREKLEEAVKKALENV